jgi:hypothetical protein
MTQLQIYTSPSASLVSIAESENLNAESIEAAPLKPESPEVDPDRRDEIASVRAIDRCINAWHRTFDLASINPEDEELPLVDEDDDFASEQAAMSFREAMPPLAGYENIRDFIACITYAMLNHIFDGDECQQLLGAAKIAMALLRSQPKS